jgi:NAD(P)-dependent dehydrogenase (short-subunit alcohol dehydrogenase family)
MISNERVLSEFEGKVAIITGGARGIGRTTALEFSKQGATVVIVDVLEKELKEANGIIEKTGNKVLCLKADVSNDSQVKDVIKKTVDNFGKIDVLVNCAGIVGPHTPVVDLSEKDWDNILQVNLKGVFLFCRGVVPVMLRNKKGAIVNIASIAAKEGNETMAAYSVSKAGVISFSRVLAKEVAKDGIRVNSISPAVIGTDFIATATPELLRGIIAQIPMGRMGRPEEVANLILFLSSEKSSFITGQSFNITGGKGYN